MDTNYGWSHLGARQLDEYSEANKNVPSEGSALRWAKKWTEVRALPTMDSLAELSVAQMRLLHAVDTFPRGGLCQGKVLKESLRRYEKLWMPLLANQCAAAGGTRGYASLAPPLDIAFLWHLHRLQPEAYEQDCSELRASNGQHVPVLHPEPPQAFAFSDGSDQAGAATAVLWRKAYPSEPFYPPAAPGSQTDSFRSHLTADLAAVAVRMPVFLHQLLRAAYLQLPFLERAVDRYAKFLLLRKHHLELGHPLPPIDIALVWSSHMSCSGLYASDCQQLLQRLFLDMPGPGASLWLERDTTGPWRFHWTDTLRAWLDEYEEPFLVPGSGYVPMDSFHPAEATSSPQLLAAFEAAGGHRAGGTGWRAGAHALYLCWLRDPSLRQQHQPQPVAAAPLSPPTPPLAPPTRQQQQGKNKKSSGGLFSCFGCGSADVDDDRQHSAAAAAAAAAAAEHQQTASAQPLVLQKLSDSELARIAAGFGSFKHLPHSSTHPYWLQLTPRGQSQSAETPSQPGPEVEFFTTAAAMNGHSVDAAGKQQKDPADAAKSHMADQHQQHHQGTTGDYEVLVGGGQPLMW